LLGIISKARLVKRKETHRTASLKTLGESPGGAKRRALSRPAPTSTGAIFHE
jgi:hypothetical protein